MILNSSYEEKNKKVELLNEIVLNISIEIKLSFKINVFFK